MSDYTKVPVLDNGYVQLIETWGSDERIIEAARMSTGKGFNGWGGQCHACAGYGTPLDSPQEKCGECGGSGNISGDEKLLAYLYNNKHSTPFEMAGMVLEVKAPIFVFREWHRHRTQSYNEMSARYIPLPDENYIPTVERLMANGGANKQAQSTGATLSKEAAEKWLTDYKLAIHFAQHTYEQGIDAGVPKELARLPVPVARYSRMRASTNLRNWLAFLALRNHPAAQMEIRQYAVEVAALIEQHFPHTFELYVNGEQHG